MVVVRELCGVYAGFLVNVGVYAGIYAGLCRGVFYDPGGRFFEGGIFTKLL